ncbi:MAG: hypothetical protein OXG91_13340 [bacterium]|nr:hypothetical protein [bacterium]
MTLPARAAPIRGDDYQHVVGWLWACEMLSNSAIASVAVEDAEGGAFDDVVVRRRVGGDIYIQAKSSNYAAQIVDRQMLLTAARPNGKSPLQHFYDTYCSRSSTDRQFSLEFLTHKGFDHDNPLLDLRDLRNDRIAVDQMLEQGPGSKVGLERDAWAGHLGISTAELADFLRFVRWKHTGSELDLRRQAKPLMRLAGFRADDGAVMTGVGIVKGWVSDGAGHQTADDVGRQAAEMGLVPEIPHVVSPSVDKWEAVLSALPPTCRTRLSALRDVSPETAGRVAAELNSTAARTPGVLAHMAEAPPEWLWDADCLAWEAIADFVAAHHLPGAWEMRRRAIERGSPREGYYRVTEALLAHGDGEADRAAEMLEAAQEYLLAGAARALIGGDSESAIAELRGSGAVDSQDPGLAVMGTQMLAMAHSSSNSLELAISAMRDAVRRFPDRAQLHLSLARLQLGLAWAQGEAFRRDLPASAARNAIRARDEYRKWDGPSAEAVAVAANAYHMLNQPQRIVNIATPQPEGEATPREAEDGEAARCLAHALLLLGRGDEIDESALDRIDSSESTLIRALQTRSRGEPGAVELMRQALEQATGERAILMALEGLAMLGETDENALSAVSAGNEEQVDGIRASAAYHRGDLDAAIALLGPYRCRSAAHVGLLAAALHGQGRTEEAYETLLESAEALSEPKLYVSAVVLLIEVGELQRAEETALVALAANPSAAEELRLREALVDVAQQLRDWPKMEQYGQALADEFSDHSKARWAVVSAMHQQARYLEAWGYLVEHDLRPADEQMALLAVGLYYASDAPSGGADRLLWIAGEFDDSEAVVGSALGALMASSSQEGQLSEVQATELNLLFEGFVERYPDSGVLRQIHFSSIDEVLEMLRTSSEEPARQRASWIGQVRFGQLPYGTLHWVRPLPYAEFLLCVAADYLTAVSPNAAERSRQQAAAQAAIGGAVAVDTSVAVLGHLAGIDVTAMGTAFAGVLVATELLDDARAAVASIRTAGSASAGYDPVLGGFNMSEKRDEDRRQQIESAQQLLGTLEGWQRTPTSRIQPGGYPQEDRLRPWDTSIRLALDRGCALWCDDLALGRLADAAGVPVFSTHALYEALTSAAETGGMPGPSEMKMRLLRARIADIPITLGELSEAVDDTDGPDPGVELFLGRPANWADDPEETLRWYLGRVAALISGPHRERAPGLLIAACCGLGSAAPPDNRLGAMGRVLADTLWVVNDPAMTPILLEASRFAGRAIDLAANLDPLEHATRRLQAILAERQIDAEMTARIVLALFSQAQPADRLAVSAIVLGNH